ncbi:MAG TPA: DUF5763 domain-containing protein, partial [Actinomycetota bacterium]|nr:DUF5763 domain-containing protein [Actinomycetota bacterium]
MTPPRSRCQARTTRGDRCRNPAGPDGLCALHRRQAEKAAADSTRPGRPKPRPSAPSPLEGERSPAAE